MVILWLEFVIPPSSLVLVQKPDRAKKEIVWLFPVQVSEELWWKEENHYTELYRNWQN